ncbi:MAG: protein-methionine-sulfoxide reductase catalytic subunit MsrP [Aestuariivirgaceae bacterium]
MLIKKIHGWEIPEHLVTPEKVFLNRRQFVAGLGIGAATTGFGLRPAQAAADPSAGLYPVDTNPLFKDPGRPVTPKEINTTYNNFYEFGTSKSISSAAEVLKTRPWDIKIDGEVEKPFTIGFDDLLKKVQLEERIYRHRCVEAWSMVVPWSGFPLRQLVELAKPLSSAGYMRFETFVDPEMAPGQKPSLFGLSSGLPGPYVEGVTMAEARNDLTFMVTGAYGAPVANSMGAPIRLHLPWKYGFKSIKSIVRVSFPKERPVGFWEQLHKSEYGFWANVNPEVPHPRWSQASERVLGTSERIPTQLFNGYGEFVADLYKDLKDEVLYR